MVFCWFLLAELRLKFLVDFLSRLKIFCQFWNFSFFLFNIIWKILFEFYSEVIEFVSDFFNSFNILSNFIIFAWINSVLLFFFGNNFSAFKFFTFYIWVIEICVILLFLRLFRLYRFGFSWRLNCRIRFLRPYIFRLIKFR